MRHICCMTAAVPIYGFVSLTFGPLGGYIVVLTAPSSAVAASIGQRPRNVSAPGHGGISSIIRCTATSTCGAECVEASSHDWIIRG